MKRPPFIRVLVLSILLLVPGGCGGGGGSDSSLFYVSKPFSFEVPRGSNTELSVIGVNGIIEVSGSAAIGTVYISGVMKVGSASSAEALLHINDMEVAVSEAGSVVRAETVQPPASNGLNYIVEYSVTLPDTMDVGTSQLNGQTSILGMDSDITASGVNGTMEVDSVMPPGGLFDLSNVNGDIALTIPADTSATLWCLSVTGRVRVYDLTISSPVQTAHSLSGTLDGGDGEISITTANGDITLYGK